MDGEAKTPQSDNQTSKIVPPKLTVDSEAKSTDSKAPDGTKKSWADDFLDDEQDQ